MRIVVVAALCCGGLSVSATEVFIIRSANVDTAQGLSPQSMRPLEHVKLLEARRELIELNCQTRTLKNVGQVLALCPNGVNLEDVKAHFKQTLDGQFEVTPDKILFRPATVTNSNAPSSTSESPYIKDTLMMTAANGFSGNDNPDIGVTPPSGDKVIVAVIDTGATIGHPYLSPALSVNSGELANSVDDDGNGYRDDIYCANSMDKNGDCSEVGTDHGSHVAGLVKMVRDQAITKYSEAARVTILPIRFIGSAGVGTTAAAIAAVDYAVSRGAKVINASWGARGEGAFSQALFDAFARAYWNNDVFFSVAAGNADSNGPNNNDEIPYFPSSFNIPSLISVASITPTYMSLGGGGLMYVNAPQSDFSNYGRSSVDIFAPGGLITSPSDFNGGVYSVNAAYPTGAAFVRKKGTSMAAPVVAGVAGVIRAINRNLTSYEVKEVILQTGRLQGSYREVTSSMAIQAAQAMSVGLTRSSAGLRPEVTAPFYFSAYQAGSTDKKKKSGGCGLVADASSSGEGPWGGNSLGLILGFYLTLVGLRKWLAQSKKIRV